MHTDESLYLLDVGDLRACPGYGDVANVRVRTIRSGDYIEAECYPIHRPGSGSQRRKRKAETSAAQAEVNRRNTAKQITRYLNANFDASDIHITATYGSHELPRDEREAQKKLSAYIRRLKKAYAKLQKEGRIPQESQLKYLYVSEYATRDGEAVRIHHHIVCNFPDREMAEELWRAGRANADRLQPDRYGLTALAKYLTKAKRNKRKWGRSRNLCQPRITVADKKLSRRQMMHIASAAEMEAKEIFIRLYPGCEYLDCDVRTSEWVQGAYIYARLRKQKPRPAQVRGRGGSYSPKRSE